MKMSNSFGPTWGNQGRSRAQTECRFYQQTGVCGYGDRCYYKHSVISNIGTEHEAGPAADDSAANPSRLASRAFNRSVCKYWLQNGTCGRGPKCWFNHPTLDKSVKQETSSEEGSHDTSSSTAVEHNDDGLCWAWKARKCFRGDSCRYRHEDPQKYNAAPSSPLSDSGDDFQASWRSLKKNADNESVASTGVGFENDVSMSEVDFEKQADTPICKYWKAMGACSQGARCTFLHSEEAEDNKVEKPFKVSLCRFWKAGNCHRGDNCTYIHQAVDLSQMTKDKEQQQLEYNVVDRRVVMDNNVVTFGAGLEIRDVVPSSEVRKLVVKGLPLYATQEAIAGIFADRGAASEDVFVPYNIRLGEDGTGEALVFVNVFQNPDIVQSLRGIKLGDKVLNIQDADKTNGAPTITSLKDEDASPYLEVSWKSPTETIFAHYSSHAEAARWATALNGNMWEGRRLSASVEEVEEKRGNYFARGTGARFGPKRGLATVKITGCPLNSSTDPRFTEFTGSTKVAYHGVFPWSCKEVVREHLAEQEGVLMETYEVIEDENAQFMKIQVHFRDRVSIERAHESVHNRQLAIYTGKTPQLRASSSTHRHYQVTILMRQYRAQKKQWDGLPAWSPDNLRAAYIQTERSEKDRAATLSIRIEGKDEQAADALKARVEELVAGEMLDESYWHPTFGQKEDTWVLCNRLFQSTTAYVRADFQAKVFKVCGEPTAVEKAKALIREEIEGLGGLETSREIDWTGGVGFFIREGLARLKEVVGQNKVRLDVTCKPAKLTILGTEEAVYDVDRIVEESKALSQVKLWCESEHEALSCPVCNEGVVNGRQLGCGHTYCLACLQHFISSAADTQVFPLVCLGNSRACRSPISIPFLRQFMDRPQQTLSKLAEAAFRQYVEAHPHKLKYCTTPDCGQLYRPQADMSKVNCLACLSETCPACKKEAHEGVSCDNGVVQNVEVAVRDDLEGPTKAGCKKCPGCSTLIDQSLGCNHMHCGHCGTHFCWVCGQAFERREIYEHLKREHAGIYGVNVNLGGAGGLGLVQGGFLA